MLAQVSAREFIAAVTEVARVHRGCHNRSLPVANSHVLIDVPGGRRVSVSGTDLDTSVLSVMDANTNGAVGAVAIDARELAKLVKSPRKGEMLILDMPDANTLSIARGGATVRMAGIAAGEFPKQPALDSTGAEILVDGTELARAIRSVAYARSLDTVRPQLAGIHFRLAPTGELELAGCDSFRLAVARVDAVATATECAFTLPAKAADAIARAADARQVTLTLDSTGDELVASVGAVTIWTRVVTGAYVDHHRVMSQTEQSGATFRADRGALLDVLKAAAPIAAQANNAVRFDLSDDTLAVKATASGAGEYSSTVAIGAHQGATGALAFDISYLIGALTAITAPEVLWSCAPEGGQVLPLLILPGDGAPRWHIVMPMRLPEVK